MNNKGNRYNEQFKEDAVRLIIKEGRSINGVAKDLGINNQTLRNWISDKKKTDDPDKSKIAELEAKLKEKERRINDLEESVTILKKATALFIQGNGK